MALLAHFSISRNVLLLASVCTRTKGEQGQTSSGQALFQLGYFNTSERDFELCPLPEAIATLSFLVFDPVLVEGLHQQQYK